MKLVRPVGSDISLSQLLDAVEERLDSIAGTLSLTDAVTSEQIDHTDLKVSRILRKARDIKNRFSPINQVPPEILTLISTFLATERDLIDATGVCRRWRTILVSFPRLWRNAGGSSSELEAYLERSKSVPIEVNLSSPELVSTIVPHTPRLVVLTICVNDSPDFKWIADHLCDPIPTLRSLNIRTRNCQLRVLELPSGLYEGLFRHLERLSLDGISAFHGPQTFLHITEISLSPGFFSYPSAHALLYTLEQLQGLVKVSALFLTNWYTGVRWPNTVTLPCVQEIQLSAVDGFVDSEATIPPILLHLRLPKATSITVQSPFPSRLDLPIVSFGDQLPNYAELPELRIDTDPHSGKAVFRSSSQAVFTYHSGPLWEYKRERWLWGDLPLSSVRKITAVLVEPGVCEEDLWLVDMLKELNFLELLELGGDCAPVLRRLRHRLVRGVMRIDIRTLIVRGGEYAKAETLKLQGVKDELGLQNMTVTYIPDPEVAEVYALDPDDDSSSVDEVWDGDSEGDSEGDDEGGGEDHQGEGGGE